jgi:hypothetical protein
MVSWIIQIRRPAMRRLTWILIGILGATTVPLMADIYDIGFVETISSSTADTLYCQLSGCNMTGDLSVDGSISLDSGGTVTTTDNGTITLDAHGTGITSMADLSVVCDGGCPSWGSADGAGDLAIEDELEVDGVAHLDGNVFLGTSANNYLFFVDGQYGGFYPLADDGMHLFLYSANNYQNNNLIITTYANRAKDHDHEAASADPTLSLSHSGTSGAAGTATIATGSGTITIDPSGGEIVAGTGDLFRGGYSAADGSDGLTDSSSYWLCTAANCSTSCQVVLKGGIITGCL